MKTKKIKLTIPEYRERKDVFLALGYKEVDYKEKDFKAYITLEIDENEPHYNELHQFEKRLYQKGPSFYPILLFVVASFVFLSIFVILFAQQKGSFDLVTNALGFLLPAFIFLLLDVIYTYFYFSINKKIIERGHPNKEAILKDIESIKQK